MSVGNRVSYILLIIVSRSNFPDAIKNTCTYECHASTLEELIRSLEVSTLTVYAWASSNTATSLKDEEQHYRAEALDNGFN